MMARSGLSRIADCIREIDKVCHERGLVLASVSLVCESRAGAEPEEAEIEGIPTRLPVLFVDESIRLGEIKRIG